MAMSTERGGVHARRTIIASLSRPSDARYSKLDSGTAQVRLSIKKARQIDQWGDE